MKVLRVGTCLAPNVEPMYRFVASYLGEALGMPAELVACDGYRSFERAGEDVAFVCSLPYVMLARRGDPPVEVVAAPVLEGERYGGRPVYFSDVIVRRDDHYRSFADLRGSRWAYNEPLSHSGYGITRYHLLRMGETAGFFGEVLEAGYHQDSIEWVLRGKVDASAIDSQVLEVEMRRRPEVADELRVIESFGPSTIQPVTVARHLPAEIRARIRELLLGMGDDPVAREGLALGMVRRFAPADDATYDDIRRMLEACEAAGFTTLR